MTALASMGPPSTGAASVGASSPAASSSNAERIADLLASFDDANRPRATAELITKLGLARATGYGLIAAMKRARLLKNAGRGRVRLGPRARALAFAARANAPAASAIAKGPPRRATARPIGGDWSSDLIEQVDGAPFRKTPPFRIAFANASSGNLWRKALARSVDYAARLNAAAIADFRSADAADDPARQQRQVEAFLEARPDALLISAAPGSGEPLAKKLARAIADGVAVIAVDRRPPGAASHLAYVTASDRLIGAAAALWLVERLAGVGRIWMLAGLRGAETAARRVEAARERFEEAPAITVEALVDTDWTAASGARAIDGLLARHGRPPDAVWCDSGLQGMGSFDAFARRDIAPPPHTGGDVNGVYKRAVLTNTPLLGIDYPAAMGARALTTALSALRGETLARRIETPTQIVLTRGAETASIKAESWAERHVRWDLPDNAISSQGPAARPRSGEAGA